MNKKYLKTCLKDLKKELGYFSKKHYPILLDVYEIGLKTSLHKFYPQEFPGEPPQVQASYPNMIIPLNFFERGKYVGQQFGPLEIGIAKELLSEIEKRKTKFSKKPFLLRRLFWEKLRGRK